MMNDKNHCRTTLMNFVPFSSILCVETVLSNHDLDSLPLLLVICIVFLYITTILNCTF